MLRLHAEIVQQRDAIAVLRARNGRRPPTRRCWLQGLAERHLALKPLNATQYDFIEEPAGAAAAPGQAGRFSTRSAR